jgi:hypothetical protein
LPDDPWLLIIVGDLILLIAVLIHVRRQHQVRRNRIKAELRRWHLAWVARQEQAERERSAAQAAETAQRERQAVAQQALHIADEIAGGLLHYDRKYAAAAVSTSTRSPEAVSAQVRPTAETIGNNTPAHSNTTAETTPARDSAKSTQQRTSRATELTDAELRHLVYSLIKIDQNGWRRWRGSPDVKGYPRVWLPGVRKWTQAYRLVYRWEQGMIPKGWTIDHACGLKDCMDHLECVTRAENLRRRHARERGQLPTGHAGMAPPRRAA